MKEKELKATVACSRRLDDGEWREIKRGGKNAEALSPYHHLLVVFSCSLFFAPSKVSERLEEAFPHIKWPVPF